METVGYETHLRVIGIVTRHRARVHDTERCVSTQRELPSANVVPRGVTIEAAGTGNREAAKRTEAQWRDETQLFPRWILRKYT